MPELPRVGEEFAGYRLVSRIGQGGMSVVFKAENWRLGNVVALKILSPELAEDDTYRTRFLQESRMAAALNHPNVVPILDYDAHDGLLYLAMRYVAGTNLRRMIDSQGLLDSAVAVRLLSQAALALDAAHRQGLVHRDVKPENLLVERTSDDAEPDHLYLADFGISKKLAGLSRLTYTGAILGTSRYISPEQAQEHLVLGPADQYALGCVLYECLTGQTPFERSSAWETVRAHVEDRFRPVTLFRPDLSPAVDTVFARVLAKEPGERYASCREFMAAASDALAQGRADVPYGAAQYPYAAGDDYATMPGGPVPPMEPIPDAWRYADGGPVPPDDGRDTLDAPDAWGGSGSGDGLAAWGGSGAPGAPGAPGGLGVPGAPGVPEQAGRARRARRRRELGAPLLWVSVVIAGVAGGVIAYVATHGGSPAARPAAASSLPGTSLPASPLATALARAADRAPGELNLATCQAVTSPKGGVTTLQCTGPAPGIKSVTFVTFGTIGSLYAEYEGIVKHQVKQPFAANTRSCSRTGQECESTWTESGQYLTTVSVAELVAGKGPADAAGRVFSTGGKVVVWTQDDGRLLGYATGTATASGTQVRDWFDTVHRDISVPRQAGSPAATTSP